MLSYELLEGLKPDTIFATGITEGIYTEASIHWVAVRGWNIDWCIYYGFSNQDIQWVRDHGEKIVNEEYIKQLVPCDDKAFARYRY